MDTGRVSPFQSTKRKSSRQSDRFFANRFFSETPTATRTCVRPRRLFVCNKSALCTNGAR